MHIRRETAVCWRVSSGQCSTGALPVWTVQLSRHSLRSLTGGGGASGPCTTALGALHTEQEVPEKTGCGWLIVISTLMSIGQRISYLAV